MNSDVRGALDELRQALELPEFGEDEELELKMKEKMEQLARDGLEAAKGVFGDVSSVMRVEKNVFRDEPERAASFPFGEYGRCPYQFLYFAQYDFLRALPE